MPAGNEPSSCEFSNRAQKFSDFAGWHRLKLCQRPLKPLSNVFQLHSSTPECVQALCNLEFHLEYCVCMQFEVLKQTFPCTVGLFCVTTVVTDLLLTGKISLLNFRKKNEKFIWFLEVSESCIEVRI